MARTKLVPSARVRNSYPYLKSLSKSTPAARKNLLQHVPDSTIHAICECASNALRGRIPLTPAHKRHLSAHKADILKVLKPGLTVKQRRQRFIQTGGFLPALIGAVLSAVPSIVSLFKK
jgi:hypothetical protein